MVTNVSCGFSLTVQYQQRTVWAICKNNVLEEKISHLQMFRLYGEASKGYKLD
jgi:hypothetical protein